MLIQLRYHALVRALTGDIADGLTRVRDNLYTRLRGAQSDALELQSPVGRTGLLSINGESHLLAAGHALNIDRCVQCILKLQILISSRDGRVVRRLHVGHDHGMVGTLCHLQLRPENCIVQSGG